MVDTVVVLASGDGKRMGQIGKTYAKCSIPIGSTIPIIRTFSYIIESGFQKIIILANEKNISQIKELIHNYEFGTAQVLCTTEFNSPQILGSLKNVANYLKAPFYMILGDIFYLQNPFPKQNTITKDFDILYGTLIKIPGEISKGGIVTTDKHGNITNISKHGIKIMKNDCQYYRWSGMALCTSGIGNDLEKLISSNGGEKLFLESIFEYRRNKGIPISFVENSDFINLNTPSHLLLINLVMSSESIPYASLETQELIAQTTQSIMKDIVDISTEQL